jgi:enamine deaminase RidA (YjgF/YER057c/UK114 family)
MLKKVTRWLDRDFVELSCEGDGRGSAAEEAHAIFLRMSNELRHFGLSLDHVVRTRLWGRDRVSRDAGSEVRFATLSGGARAASSSYIAPERFDNPSGRVALDLVALKTPAPPAKTIRENDPPRMPIRYMTVGDLVILSGMTNQQPSLDDQLADIMPRIGAALKEAGSAWNKVALMSGYLHRSQSPEALKAGIAKWTGGIFPTRLEIGFADGYSAPDKLIEIETTATR